MVNCLPTSGQRCCTSPTLLNENKTGYWFIMHGPNAFIQDQLTRAEDIPQVHSGIIKR